MMKRIKSSPVAARTVVCIYCRRPQEVGTRALSIPCRFCHKTLPLEDVHIAGYAARRTIETCGTVTIETLGNVTVNSVTCATLHLSGKLKGNVVSLGPVSLAASAVLHGDITAPVVTIAEGACLRGRCHIAGHS